MTESCPSPEDLSAYLDGELPADVRARTAAHLVTCAACAARYAELEALRADFAALPDERLGFDLSQVIRGRIDALPVRPEATRTPRWRAGNRRAGNWRVANWRGLLPIGAAAVASLSLGLALGTSLIAPAAVTPAIRVLEVFAPVAPGGLCSGLGSCWHPAATTRQLP